MYRIKICGITRVSDAQLINLAGADAIGLNFYPHSPRSVDMATAEQIASVLPARVFKAGVFVNAEVDEVRQIADSVKLEGIQLHGDEPPEMLAEFPDLPIVRAFRFGERGLDEIRDYLARCRTAGRMPDGVLVDACRPGEYGGTGEQPDWEVVRQVHDVVENIPVILAGGLTPFNVAEAIATARPSAVDVASGVESKPGHKDPLLVRAFVNAARKAFEA